LRFRDLSFEMFQARLFFKFADMSPVDKFVMGAKHNVLMLDHRLTATIY
jgi:hypothetical protein